MRGGGVEKRGICWGIFPRRNLSWGKNIFKKGAHYFLASPFLGPSARKCNGGLGANHPVLSHTLPVYLPQISPGTHLKLGRLWLSLQSHATDSRPKLNNWVHWDSNPRPFRQRIPNPAHQPTRLGRR